MTNRPDPRTRRRSDRVALLREQLGDAGLLDPPQARAHAERRIRHAPSPDPVPPRALRERRPLQPRAPGCGWRIRVDRPPVLDADPRIRAHEAMVVRVAAVPDPEERVLVVLREREGLWTLASPVGPDAVRLSDLERTPEGEHRFELATGAPGRERLVVGLVSLRAAEGLTTADDARTLLSEGLDPLGVADVDIVG